MKHLSRAFDHGHLGIRLKSIAFRQISISAVYLILCLTVSTIPSERLYAQENEGVLQNLHIPDSTHV